MDKEEAVHVLPVASLDENKCKQLIAANDCFLRGLDLWEIAHYQESLQQFQKTLTIRENMEGLGHNQEEIATTYFWIGQVHFMMDEYDPSLDAFRQTLRIRTTLIVLGDFHHEHESSIVVVHDWIKQVLIAKGMSDRYILSYSRALWNSIAYELHGKELFQQERYEDAICVLRLAVALHRTCKDLEPSCDEADMLGTIGGALVRMAGQENLEMAIIEYRKAWTICENKLDEAHLDTLP
jgi:tetratricopeptide (TPR) repeat protein